MKILIFSLTYFPHIGGAEVAVKEITNRIDNTEFDLICARLDRKLPKQEKIGNINVYRVGWGCKIDKYLYPVLANLQARKLHKKKNYQIIQAIMAMWGGIAALFFKWLNPQIKYLLTMQSGDTDEFIHCRTWFWAPIYAQVYREADYIQAISQYLAQRARQFGYKGEISVIPNGVDIGFSQQYDVEKNKKTIITVSRLVEKNGVEYLIKAMSFVDAKLFIIGEGKDEKKLRKLVENLKISDKVIFKGQVNHEILPKYLQASGIFVRSSLSEGLGNAFLEAMLCGLPIIGTPVGGIVDFLKDGETGLFCQTKNPQSIAEKINLLLQDENLYNKLVQNGQKIVREKYDWKNITEDFKNLYKKVI